MRGIFNKHHVFVILLGFVILVICLLPYILTRPSFLGVVFSETGQIGDTIGGIMGPPVAILAVVLAALAFRTQYEANIDQRKSMFENMLFMMMNQLDSIKNSLYYSPVDGSDSNYGKEIIGINVFRHIYEEKEYFDDHIEYGLKSQLKQRGYQAYDEDDDLLLLRPYFLFLLKMLKYIERQSMISKSEKKNYISIVASSLSRYELVHLFYFGLSDFGKATHKSTIERHSLLSALNIDDLASKEDKDKYLALINQGIVDKDWYRLHAFKN